MLQNQTLRSILLGTMVVGVLGAYVWHRRSTIQKRSPQASVAVEGDRADGGQQQQGNGPGPDGPRGPDDGRRGPDGQGPDGNGPGGPDDGQRGPDGSGPDGNGGPQQQGVGVGEPDPSGRPGLDGPRSTSACMVRGSSGPHSYQVNGTVTIVNPDPNIQKLGKKAVTTVVATNVPVEQWGSAPKVLVYESFFLKADTFRFDFSASERMVYLCAFQTTDYQEFTYVHTAGCTPQAIVSRGPGTRKEANNIRLELKTLVNTSELLGFSSFIPPDLWPGTTRRAFTGKVTLPGAPAGTRYLLAFATKPIMESTEDIEGNPSALVVTQPDGLFGTAFLSPPDAAQFACAVALPPRGTDISQLKNLQAPGCIPITLPAAGPSGTRIDNVILTLNPSKSYSMTDHERQHFSFLARCFDG
ncbi:MAG: hypothetical protein VX223_12465 [Myxococcota bacterium]|nr:hypothetical protein [Myxococcota bacterium]